MNTDAKLPGAREAAIAAIEEAMLGTLPVPFGVLSEKVETLIDAVAAAIEARDAALRSAVAAELRPEVRVFALLMEAKLRENDHKGGWKECDLTYLSDRIKEETRELFNLFQSWHLAKAGHMSAPTLPEVQRYIGREAADVANFAMMIADVCGALATRTGGNEE